VVTRQDSLSSEVESDADRRVVRSIRPKTTIMSTPLAAQRSFCRLGLLKLGFGRELALNGTRLLDTFFLKGGLSRVELGAAPRNSASRQTRWQVQVEQHRTAFGSCRPVNPRSRTDTEHQISGTHRKV
jgi:hypothetical protein